MKYRLFCLRRLWRNRDWTPPRQKYKAMDKDWERQVAGKMMRYI